MPEHDRALVVPNRERRQRPDGRLGRRRSDVWFPYNPAFVVQVLAQGEAVWPPRAPVEGIRAYGSGLVAPEVAENRDEPRAMPVQRRI